MIEFIVSGGIVVVLSTVIAAVPPLRHAFLDIWDTFISGPRRFVWGLMYIYAGRKNPELEEKRIQQRTREVAERSRWTAQNLRAKIAKADAARSKRNEQHIADIRLWQEEYIRLENPELYAKHIAPYKKHEMNVLNYPEVGSHASLGLHAEAEQRVQRAFLRLDSSRLWQTEPGQPFDEAPDEGDVVVLQEPEALRLEVSERRWNPQTNQWGHYKRYTNGTELWTY